VNISVPRLRAQCLELIRLGKTVARLTPPAGSSTTQQRPWEILRGSGALAINPEESVIDAQAFDVLR